MDTSNGAVPHHSVSTHSHHHHRLGLLHISYSLLVFLVNGERQYIRSGVPSFIAKVTNFL